MNAVALPQPASISEVKVGGLRFVVRDGSSDIKALREVVEKKSYWRRDFMPGNGTWVDAGANIGAFTCLVAAQGCRVTAYEPDPDSYQLLEQNVQRNGLGSRVELHQRAIVADDRREVVFHINSANRNFWRNSIMKPWRGGHSIVVPAVHYSKVFDAAVDCKMDIEGAEMPILDALDGKPGKRFVFEWSFDIDRSIPRFLATKKKLLSWFPNVRYGKFDETKSEWSSSWFPPCRTVWCW